MEDTSNSNNDDYLLLTLDKLPTECYDMTYLSTAYCSSVGTIESPWVPEYSYIDRYGFWGFTDFSAAGTMPDFDYAADVVVSATKSDGRSSMAPTAFSFNDKFAGDEINSNFGWPDCGSGCTLWSNDPVGFADEANAAYLAYDGPYSSYDGYVKAIFSASDTTGWSEVAIGVFEVDSTCQYPHSVACRDLQTDWTLRDVFIEHSWDLNTAARVDTYHLTMSVDEFARAGDYVIMAYDPNDLNNYVAYAEEHTISFDLGLYGVEFA